LRRRGFSRIPPPRLPPSPLPDAALSAGTAVPASPGGSATNTDQTFGARWITDLDVGYRVTDRFTVAAGANNLFGVYPEQNFRSSSGADNSNAGIFPYNQVSPFGFNGAFYYLRVSWNGM